MSLSLGKNFDYLSGVAELSGKVANSLQNFIAARTAIRDYVISADEKHYVEVERLTTLAVEMLEEADAMVERGRELDVIQQFLESIAAWSEIAEQVRDGFASYHTLIRSKVLANFTALAQSGNDLLKTNVPLTTGVMLDVQIANVAIVGYLLNGEDHHTEDAQKAINSARDKIDQARESKEHLIPALESFVATLDVYADGFFEAVDSRKDAYKVFNEDLAPLGAKVQSELEQFHQQLLYIQQGINEMKVLNENRKKDPSPLH